MGFHAGDRDGRMERRKSEREEGGGRVRVRGRVVSLKGDGKVVTACVEAGGRRVGRREIGQRKYGARCYAP